MRQRLLFEGELSDVALEDVLPTLISKTVETNDDVFLRWNGATIRVEPTDTIDTLMQKYDKEIGDRENVANAAAERAKPGAATIEECQETMRRLGEAMKGLGCQESMRRLAARRFGKTDDVLTEEKVYDFYQERAQNAGERADQLAWMFIVMMTGVLISGHTYQTFAECAALSAIYMLLSVTQAVWQTFTSWLFKQQIKKMDVAPDDYPSWVGGGAWLFFWAKMISISAAVCYFIYVIFS